MKYTLKKLKRLNISNMINIAKEISDKTNKLTFFILIDMVISAFKYGSGYMDYFEFEFYLLNHKQRKTYITGRINNKIIKEYNNKEYNHFFSNKYEFNNLFNKYLKREYILITNDNYSEFEKFLENKKQIIVKPLSSTGGKGIEIISISEETNKKLLFEDLLKNNQTLIEEVIVQNQLVNELYSKSVNTLRIITFLKDNNEAEILKVIFKIGNGGVVDNFSSGGMYTFVNEEGEVYVPAIDEKGNIFETHPISNQKIVGFKIPSFDKVEELVKSAALEIKEIRYIGWDVALSEKGPCLIEGNEYSGIFQVKPSLSKTKIGDLPNYKKYMTKI